jgi:ABC-type Fe3+/spermidine/putrescine transport system ATPase subunit
LISIKDLRKAFGGRDVLRDLCLDVERGEVLGLVGPSGVGKSTTLNIVAGLLEPDSGEISIDGVVVTRRGDDVKGVTVPPAMRGLGYVMQDAALFPNMNVHDNVAFGPQSQELPEEEVEERVDELLRMVHVEEDADSYPDQLSGGQQKRVALARTLAVGPKILLMDEPLTSLNPELKKQLMSDLNVIFEKLDATVIYVTHDPEEAEVMVDRVVRLEGGRALGVGDRGPA